MCSDCGRLDVTCSSSIVEEEKIRKNDPTELPILDRTLLRFWKRTTAGGNVIGITLAGKVSILHHLLKSSSPPSTSPSHHHRHHHHHDHRHHYDYTTWKSYCHHILDRKSV